MNANELADLLISTKFQVDEDGTMIGVSHQAVDEAVPMLRQQQDKLTKYELRHAEQRKRIEELETLVRQQQAEIEALTTQFVRVADENNRLKDKIEMLTKGKVEYGYDTTKTS